MKNPMADLVDVLLELSGFNEVNSIDEESKGLVRESISTFLTELTRRGDLLILHNSKDLIGVSSVNARRQMKLIKSYRDHILSEHIGWEN